MSPTVAAFALVALCFAHSCPVAAAAAAETDAVSARRPLRGDDTVVSAQGKFAAGLFSPGSSGRFYLGVWYKNIPVQTVIWVANRASPLSSAASAELRVSPDDGGLELVAASEGVVWSSSRSNLSAEESNNNNTAVIRDDGNLVLLGGGNSSDVLWQSFDHPTDTLVPGAWLGENKLTGEYQGLTAWRNAEDPAPGMFSNTVDRNGTSEFFYLWNRTRVYWRSGVWTGRVFVLVPEAVNNVLFNQTYVETPAYRRLSWALYDNATITRQVFEGTGQAKQYIWVPASQRWQFFWAAPTVQCDAYAVCGAFGVCDQRSQPSCRCPPGFVPASERDWALSDWTGGCRRNSSLACARDGNGSSSTSTSTDVFLALPNVKLPDDSLAVGRALSKTECESACLDNCSCQAYTFSGGGRCAVWHGEFRNLQQLYTDDSGASGSPDLHLRLSESGLRDLSRANKKNEGGLPLQLVVGIVLACVAAALIASALLAWFLHSRRRRRRRLDSMANEAGSSLAVYSYGDLRAATKNFSDRLGGGGFGSVYRGVLKSGDTITEVAVKKLEGLRQGDKQFRTEVNTLGRIQHVNLVRLLGFCSSADEKLLVYEYMPNGSLEGYLFKGGGGGSCPSWRDRYGIMLGVARGLAYLHDGCRECIIHCDVKPENILLDKDLCVKLADFGMAKLVGRDFSRALTTMRGTIGYLAPEWISGLPISAKADVYSFGMVLFELISGRRNTDSSGDGRGGDDGSDASEAEAEAGRPVSTFFPVWAAGKVAAGEAGAVADPRLRGDVRGEELERACRVACWCIQDQEAHRPTMAQAVQALEGVVHVDMPPMPRTLQNLTLA
ncbi:hypothetical protein CFC21_083041 [Triticum aestivum]|uniref:Receptor-like serine/threonine-protein kinase n=3 Tax=Triticum TaxID=4564 RepID=A0A9R0XYR5_TRITD|nr:G-type lectin S-receptor-like serine/threonine-protein kinase At2g19130 [Triticum dicoccoides]XP_044408402.1 G-type lectin S-receptor-like serine/threonine-protein kinase At2g19130 [Triticum aestivum]KAF7078640.1 hypothetical protein CFC21_083041 [Triticum aestivum]VAI44947.1 unnamed protein product [Triticum turgidum subsp. durum]